MFEVRKAAGADAPKIRAMQHRSMMELGGRHYRRDVLERFVASFGTMDFAVIDEGHFFVAVGAAERIVGTGGWSRRTPGYHGAGAGAPGGATVRGVFVAPEMARRGIARALMRRVEHDALGAGASRLELTATLSGVSLYESVGYAVLRRRAIELGDGLRFGCVDMEKPLIEAAAPVSMGLVSGRA